MRIPSCLVAVSLSLVACGGSGDDTPASATGGGGAASGTGGASAGKGGGAGASGGKGGGAGTSGGGTSAGKGGASASGGASAGGKGGTAGTSAGGAGAGAGGNAGAAGSGPGKQTVSDWMGTNLSGDLPYVDVGRLLAPFDTPAAQQDANGYPVAGASGTSNTDIGFILPTGTYKVSFKGTGTLGVSGIGKLVGGFTTVAGEQRGEIAITGSPGNFGQFLALSIANGPGQTVTDVKVLFPGFDYGTTQVFLPQLLGLLKPFRAIRFMDWEATNGSTLANWSDRPTAARFGASPYGQPYEHIVGLVNTTGKDCWLTIPEHASDDFVHQWAKLLASKLDFAAIDAARKQEGNTAPFQILLEASNETWNNGFTANKTFLAAAASDPTRYPGTYAGTYGPSWMSGNADLMKVGQYEADRLVKHATIFRDELKAIGKSDIVAPVLSGWALGAVYSDVGLAFIAKNYGDPKQYVSYVAMAPYFGPDDAKTGSLDALFQGAKDDIASKDATYADFAKLVAQYGLKMAAYEGGQGLSGATNQSIKHLAQHDKRMHDVYGDYFALWKKHFGPSLFMHFSLAGDGGLPENIYQYGFWGSIASVLEDPAVCGVGLPTLTGSEPIASVVHHCPKYRALAEQVP